MTSRTGAGTRRGAAPGQPHCAGHPAGVAEEADAMLRERFFKASITDAYDDVGADLAWDDSLQDDDVLLAPAPFDALYPHYLCAMTDAALGRDRPLRRGAGTVQRSAGRACGLAAAELPARGCTRGAGKEVRRWFWQTGPSAEQPQPAAGLRGPERDLRLLGSRVQRGGEFFCPGFPGAEHPQAAPQAAGADRAERYVSPERAADRLRERISSTRRMTTARTR